MTQAQILDAVKRACSRGAAAVWIEMSRGVSSLAMIASTAPLIGVFGTVLGIVNSFRGFDGEKSAIMAMEARGLSDSLMFTELGLFVALITLCFYKYLKARLDSFDVEIKNGALELIDELALFTRRR